MPRLMAKGPVRPLRTQMRDSGSHGDCPPVGLRIPAIDVHARVTRLDLNKDQTVEVPSNPADTGWYRLGPPEVAGGIRVVTHAEVLLP